MVQIAMTQAPAPLSPEQMEFFDREGYVIVEGLFSDGDLQPVIDEIHQEVNRRARDLVAQGELSRTYEEQGFERQLAHISRETDKVAMGIWSGVLAGPALFDLIRNAKVLDVAEQVCGSSELIASAVYRLRPQLPNYYFGAVPWHQDSGYTEPYCDRSLMLTVWLPLVDATIERGCMWVQPRVHKRHEVFKHVHRPNKPYLVIPDPDLPAEKPVPAEVRKGGALF